MMQLDLNQLKQQMKSINTAKSKPTLQLNPNAGIGPVKSLSASKN